MSNNALYFPYINCPKSDWFNRVLLYWDSVQSIVPEEVLRGSGNLSNHMSKLISSGLVQTIDPSQYVAMDQNFFQRFIRYLEEKTPQMRRTMFERIHRSKMISSPVHIGKMGLELVDFLTDRQLARQDNGSWIQVEPRIASAYMTYLACHLSKIPEISATAVTPDPQSFNLLGARKNQTRLKLLSQISRSRTEVLNILLPAPENASVHEILNFKEKHRDHLNKIRSKVEAWAEECASLLEDDLVSARISRKKDELVEEIGAVEAQMNERWSNVLKGSIMPLIKIALGGGVAVQGNNALELGGGAFSVVEGACDLVRLFQNRNEWNNHPLAYAVIAHDVFAENIK